MLIVAAMTHGGGQTAASAGTFPGTNGKIAFAASGHINLIKGDGTDRVTLNVASPASSVNEPAWNKAGTKLVFRDGGSSFSTMNANGGKVKRLVSMDSFVGNPTWSPSGSVIAFDHYIGGINQENRIYTVPVTGGTATELLDLDAQDPTYSPDGTRIAFEESAADSDIGVMNANGSNVVILTSGSGGNNADFDPSWSPDGTKIAFTRAKQIWTMNGDGSGAVQLTTGADASYPTWSPDGAQIAFQRGNDIWVMDNDGSDVANITNNPGAENREPDWGVASPPPTALISIGPAGGNAPNDALFAGTSTDGTHVFFETPEKLVAHDSDGASDVYESLGGQLTLITGPNSRPAFFAGALGDGSTVFFETADQLVASDTDSAVDVYSRSGGFRGESITLFSTGPEGGNGNFAADFVGSSDDGATVFFETKEKLCPSDVDAIGDGVPWMDVYARTGGSTSFVSAGPGHDYDATFVGSSADGSLAFFETREAAHPDDGDKFEGNWLDVFQMTVQSEECGPSSNLPTLISTGPADRHRGSRALFEGASTDGLHVFFSTDARLTGADSDEAKDIYVRSEDDTAFVATAGSSNPNFAGVAADGSTVFFETEAALADRDTDSTRDVYRRSGTSTTLISTGALSSEPSGSSFAGASENGSIVFFTTRERLAREDRDSRSDVYRRLGSRTSLISRGPAGGNGSFHAGFVGVSVDGSRVFFQTEEKLVPADMDASKDIYMAKVTRSRSSTNLVSTGATGGNGAFDALFVGASADGSRAFFQTNEKLVPEDTDAKIDVYERLLP
jgi:hypothetical protein